TGDSRFIQMINMSLVSQVQYPEKEIRMDDDEIEPCVLVLNTNVFDDWTTKEIGAKKTGTSVEDWRSFLCYYLKEKLQSTPSTIAVRLPAMVRQRCSKASAVVYICCMDGRSQRKYTILDVIACLVSRGLTYSLPSRGNIRAELLRERITGLSPRSRLII